jgi:alpha-amylase
MTPLTLRRVLRWLLPVTAAATILAQSEPAVSVPRFTHPEAGQVFYFLLTDRFANGNTANDRGGIPGGREADGFDPARISHYHGGDFAGLTKQLDYIKGLGATAVWVTPPFKNKAVQSGTAGYHGYWILDFMHIDPHLGADAEFGEFVAQAHARGLKVYMDIIVNHTADVIHYEGGDTTYVEKSVSPYRDAAGKSFDEQTVAYNGLNFSTAFPTLSPERSFPHVPIVPAAEATAKNPAWLNNPIYYHNRGNSLFRGENSLHGDFVGLDDLFTEQAAVVRGFIDIYHHWIKDYGVDGFRIDTAKHVNLEFWQAFAPAIREEARSEGKPGFIQFGEVSDSTGDVALLSEFSTAGLLDTTLDFGFFRAARRFISQAHSAEELTAFFAVDDYYTDHAGNVHATTTFLGNHDAGRFAYFIQQDNPTAPPDEQAALVKLGHGLLLLSRGQPVLYYGDEQGMIGRGGNDMQAREDMFAAQAPDFKNAALLATKRTGADEKFDQQHPFYRAFHELAALREANPALSRGAMIPRPTGDSALFAFSRIERSELVEYIMVFNNSRTDSHTAHLPTSQPGGAALKLLYSSQSTPTAVAHSLTADSTGAVNITLSPLQYAVWRAAAPLRVSSPPLQLKLTHPAPQTILSISTREVDGHILPVRQEILADVSGGDGVDEVTFTMVRGSRPNQYELLGVDDAPPYRIFWRPPADLAPDEELSFIATVNNLRGILKSDRIDGIKVAASNRTFGITGSTVPVLKNELPASLNLRAETPLSLNAQAEGTGPLYFQWLRDGNEIPDATKPELSLQHPRSGGYRVAVRGLAGTVISEECVVLVKTGTR